MYRVYLMDDSPSGDSRLVATSTNPLVVASVAGGIMAGLPEFRGPALRQMVSRRRGALLSAIEASTR